MRKTFLHIRKVRLHMRKTFLHMRKVRLHMRKTFLHIRKVRLHMRENFLHLRKVRLHMRENFLHIRKARPHMRETFLHIRKVRLHMRKTFLHLRKWLLGLRELRELLSVAAVYDRRRWGLAEEGLRDRRSLRLRSGQAPTAATANRFSPKEMRWPQSPGGGEGVTFQFRFTPSANGARRGCPRYRG